MSEQATGEVTGLQDADDRADALTEEGDTVIEYEPLFEDESITEAELRGEDPGQDTDEKLQGDDTVPPEPKGDEKEPDKADDDKKADDDTGKKDDKKGDEEAKESEGEPDYTKPPPKGYVPLPALQDERKAASDLRKALSDVQAQSQDLLAEVEALKKAPVSSVPEWAKDFKVLSVDEFDELVDEDPDQALKYQNKLNEYRTVEDARNKTKLAEKQREDNENRVVTESVQAIQEAFPDLYNGEKPEIMEAFVKTATDNGFDSRYLEVLTRPDTRIIPAGSKVAIPLASGALSLTKLIGALHSTKDVRSEIEKEIRPQIEKEVTEKLLRKLKNSPAGDFRSITDVPGSGDQPTGSRILSESELGKLSDSDYEKYMSGNL